MPAIAALKINQRTDWSEIFAIPIDPPPDETWQARSQIRDKDGNLLAEPITTVLSSGAVKVELNRAQTDIAAGIHNFDLLLEDPTSQKRRREYWANIQVLTTYTQWSAAPGFPDVEPEVIPLWLTEVIDGAIATHNASPGAHGGQAGGSRIVLVSGVALSGDRVVMADATGLAVYVDGTNPAHAGRALGVTVGAAMLGQSVEIATSEELSENSWNWSPGLIFVGALGSLTQTPPVGGFTQPVATVIAPTRILVNVQPATLR